MPPLREVATHCCTLLFLQRSRNKNKKWDLTQNATETELYIVRNVEVSWNNYASTCGSMMLVESKGSTKKKNVKCLY